MSKPRYARQPKPPGQPLPIWRYQCKACAWVGEKLSEPRFCERCLSRSLHSGRDGGPVTRPPKPPVVKPTLPGM